MADLAVPTARRVRVLGDLFHGRIPDGAVYVGRAAPGLPGSPFSNPFAVRDRGRDRALALYRAYLDANPALVERARVELAGRDLACWCQLDQPCHVDELLKRVQVASCEPCLTCRSPRTACVGWCTSERLS